MTNTTRIWNTLGSLLLLPILLTLASPAQAQETRARYVTIPVNGQIGVETVSDGFTKTFEIARRDKFNTVLVLTFDSVGGSSFEARKIIEAIEATGDQFERIGIVKNCIGPALGILLTCDRIYIADPMPEGVVIEFQPASGGSDEGDAAELAEQQALYRKLVANKPKWQPIIAALVDPTVDLYAWRGAPDEIITGNTPPRDAEFMHIELTKALGITAAQAIAGGLAQKLENGMDGLGQELGFKTFRPSATKGSVLMQSAAKDYAKVDTRIDDTIDRAFRQIETAQDLINDLPRQQYFAENADPRGQKYQSMYNLTWVNNRWVYAGRSLRAWKKNTDNAITQWRVVVNTLDEIGNLGRQARDEIDALTKESESWPPESARHSALESLQKQADELLARGQSLQLMRDQAVSQITFFEDNRNRPIL